MFFLSNNRIEQLTSQDAKQLENFFIVRFDLLDKNTYSEINYV